MVLLRFSDIVALDSGCGGFPRNWRLHFSQQRVCSESLQSISEQSSYVRYPNPKARKVWARSAEAEVCCDLGFVLCHLSLRLESLNSLSQFLDPFPSKDLASKAPAAVCSGNASAGWAFSCSFICHRSKKPLRSWFQQGSLRGLQDCRMFFLESWEVVDGTLMQSASKTCSGSKVED